jgi:uncharacterized protein (UPF0335 family)
LQYTYVPQRDAFEDLPINCEVGEPIGEPRESFEVDWQRMKRQNVSNDFYLSFYNATGLDYSHRFGYFHAFCMLSHNQDNPFVRLSVFNEIASLLENNGKLLPNLKEAINYEHYEQKIKKIEKLEENKKWAEDKLKELNAEINEQEKGKIGSASKNLYEIVSRMLGLLSDDGFQELSQKRERAFQKLLENAQSRKAFNVFLIRFNDGGNTTMCLKRTENNDTKHLTLMDAIAYLHKMGLRIFTIDPSTQGQDKKKLQLFHSFIPKNATKVAYLIFENDWFSALLPETKAK